MLARVIVRGETDAGDAMTARLRLGHLLAGADLRPRGLPPAAILCVRRISDPRPGTLRLRAGELRAPPEWERAFVASLDRALRDAARPAREAVPAGAGAVLFADRAELLACLARDAVDGTASMRWWWRGELAARSDTPGAIADAWLQEPEQCPAALELLAARGHAVRFARMLSPAVAVSLAARVATAFAAPALRDAIETAGRWGRPAAAPPDGWRGGSPEVPWHCVVSETGRPPTLMPEQQLALGVLLALRRRQALARSETFAAGVKLWCAGWRPGEGAPPQMSERSLEPDDPSAASTPPTGRRPAGRPRAARGHRPPPRLAPHAVQKTPPGSASVSPRGDAQVDGALAAGTAPSGRGADGRSSARAAARPPAPSAPVGSSGGVPTAPDAGRLEPAERSELGSARGSSSFDAGGRGPRSLPAPPAAAPQPSRARTARPDVRGAATAPVYGETTTAPEPLARSVPTELGGLFYLLNLALYLDLYGDFTTPLEPGLPLDPWDLVDLIGAWLLGGRPVDPVWPLLAELAGRRRGEPAGRGFRPPRSWRVPPAWLEPVACDGVWRWSAAGGVLRILHPAGFPVVAAPRTAAAPAVQLRTELRRIGRPARCLRRSALPREPARPVARWVARLGSYARARLTRALDLADAGSVAPLLLAHRAEVLVSPTHVDVRLALAGLPLEIRFAGLDRTPGWLPAAGRFVAFHFA